MLTLQLTLDNKQITLRVDGQESHTFSLLDLAQTDKEWKDFFKDPRPYGGKLFQALFKDSSEARKMFDELSKQSERTIVLVLESSELDGVAWEYAYQDNAYIVEDFAFVRALPEKERPHANGRLSKNVERVPLLFIPANPLVDLSGEPLRELDIESEWREMTQHIVKSNAPFDLIELRPATPAALQSVMARFQNGVIAHFSGHGAATKDGAFLLFENENGSSNPLEAREFVREVKDQAWIGFLSACQSAVAERTEFGNLARELVKAGVQFALGMQFNLPDPFAPNISGQFYNYLSQGHAVPEAARQARRAVKRENEFYVGMIALYAAHPDEAGKLGWTGSGARTLSTFAEADVSDLPTPSGFIGRQRELMNIGTKLLGKKKPNTVTLHGAGGIGKTALMRQALLHFAPSFEATLAIGLDTLPSFSLESVLGRLERFLKLPSPCSNDTKEREQIVYRKLTVKETLLGLDNFETLIHARDNGSDKEKKTSKSLYAFFKSLAAEGVTLCVTSREKTAMPGEAIQEIYGLEDESGGRLFQNTVSTRRDALNKTGLKKICVAVGGHPLALLLLAPVFEKQAGLSLEQFIEKLQTFLPKASDQWLKHERHESLDACFSFSLDNLPKNEEGENLQIYLPRLSVFIAYFTAETSVPVLENRIPKSQNDFDHMCQQADNILHSLWEYGLLERGTISFPDENYYLYRMHPVLKVFAKERLSNIETIRENYWASMSHFIGAAEEEIGKSPFVAQIVLHALPDLLHAAEFEISSEDALLMHFRVSKALKQFGFYDEALRLMEKSLIICDKLSRLGDKSVVIGEMAVIFAMQGDLDKGLILQKEKLAMVKKMGDKCEESISLNQIAHIYVARGELDAALSVYQQSLAINEKLGDIQSKSNILCHMANIYVTRGELDEAMKLYKQSIELDEGSRSKLSTATTINQMAHICEERGELDEALNLYLQSLAINEEYGDLRGKADTMCQMSSVHMARKEWDGALDLCQQSLKIYEDFGDLPGKASSLNYIGVVLFRKNHYSEALKSFLSALEINIQLKRKSGMESSVYALDNLKQTVGSKKFQEIWQEVTGNSQLPEWLSQPAKQE